MYVKYYIDLNLTPLFTVNKIRLLVVHQLNNQFYL